MIPNNLEQSGAADSCAATIGDPEDNLDDVTEDARGSGGLHHHTTTTPLSPVGDNESYCTTSQDYVDCPIVHDPVCDKSITVTALTEISGPADSGRTVTRDSTSQRTRKIEPPPSMPRRADFGDHYPDGGWGWVVCGAAFTVHFIAHGLHLAYGTVLTEIVSRFNVPITESVWIGSGSFGMCLLLWPLVVAVCRRKSPRLLAVVGGLVLALGCLFLSFSTQKHQLFISFVCAISLGTSITLSTASIIVGRYFYKRRECAEMLILTGSGVGMAVMSVFIRHVLHEINWLRGFQAVTGLTLPTVIAGALYRSANLYHPRRRAIQHIKSLKKTKKQRRDFEEKPPYIDLDPLKMRSLQVLMLSTFITSVGTYTPFVLLGEEAMRAGVSVVSVSLLMVFQGVAFACGSLVFGLVVIRSSLRCMIARQYLCQLAALGCGLSTLLLTLATSFDAYALYIWTYGLCFGGYSYALKVYTYELVSVKLSERSWGYVVLTKSLPVAVGPVISYTLNTLELPLVKPGFLFAGGMIILGAAVLFLMPWASNHHSNHEIIQQAHFKAKIFTDQNRMFYGMDISSDMDGASTKALNNCKYVFQSLSHLHKKQNFNANGYNRNASTGHKVKLYNTRPSSLGLLTEEGDNHWSEIENMSPMSATDKVTGFLLQSQAMIQNYSQIRNMEIPDVRLEITNKYEPNIQNNEDTIDEIKAIKLEATICRNSPKRVQNDVNTNHKKMFSIIDIKGKHDTRSAPDANYINFTDDSSTEHTSNQKTTAV